MDCTEAATTLQFLGALKHPITKGTKLWRTRNVGNGLTVKRCHRISQATVGRPRHGAYSIQESTAAASLVQRHPNRFRASLTLSLLLWFVYFTGRLNWVRTVQSSIGYQCSLWAILVAEIFLAVHELFFSLNILLPLFTRCRTSLRPRQRLLGKHVPTVDVCITCCGEPTEVILNTVAAAAAQDYPSNNFRVFVLDDGHSMALRMAIQALGARLRQKGGPEIHYRSRDVKQGERSYFKAGNLQFGIQEARKAGNSEYFASLDADMITEPDWLRRMLPYLLADSRIALVNPPQVT
jgi:membrane glycosyltransferase